MVNFICIYVFVVCACMMHKLLLEIGFWSVYHHHDGNFIHDTNIKTFRDIATLNASVHRYYNEKHIYF